jgi:hypothetical protein
MKELSAGQKDLFDQIRAASEEGERYFRAVIDNLQSLIDGKAADVDEHVHLNLRFIRETSRQLSELVSKFTESMK